MHHTKDKGDLALIKVMVNLINQGYALYQPFSEHSKADLIAEKDNKLYKIQVKHSIDGFIRNITSWSDKNGTHRNTYKPEDFDYYALYLQPIDTVVFVPFEYGGKKISFRENKASGLYYWYEDFLIIGNQPIKRYIKSTYIRKRANRVSNTNWPSKEELEVMVWKKPVAELSKELGVSDSAIGKYCKRLGIKKPSRGYWRKITRVSL